VSDSTPEGCCVFLSDPYQVLESKIFEKLDPEPESLFNLGIVAGVCVVICEVKTLVIFSCLNCSRSLNRSRILKFKQFPDTVSSEISDFCEISDLLLFFSYFASQNKELKSGNYFFDVCCVN